jgi:hypothetical protein
MHRQVRTVAFVCALGIGLPGVAAAALVPMTIGLYPTGDNAFDVGEVGAAVTFDVRVSGARAANMSLGAYDFVIAYDPNVIMLQYSAPTPTGFSGFGNFLGTEANTLVINVGPDDAINGATNYQGLILNPPFSTGIHVGPTAGTPTTSPGGNPRPYYEGSLRFTQLSLLSDSALKNGGDLNDPTGGDQHGAAGDTFTLFSLTFDVLTDAVRSTNIFIVDNRDYDGFVDGPTDEGGGLDYKLGCFDIKPGSGCEDNSYLVRVGSNVTVPVPATVLLFLSGLIGLVGVRTRRT